MTDGFNRIYKTGNDVRLVDDNGEDLGTSENKLISEDTSQADILGQILNQLKLIEKHLYHISDSELTIDDIIEEL